MHLLSPLQHISWSIWQGRRQENFKRQDRIMLNLVDGEQPPEDFGRRLSDLFFRKSSLAAVKKNDYIFKSFLNYSYYDTFFIGLKASLRWRSWTKCLIIPLTFWDLDFALFLFFKLRWLMLLSYLILSLGFQLLWKYSVQTFAI